MLGRTRLPSVLLGGAGVILFVSLFLPWYDARGKFLAIFGAVNRIDFTPSAWRLFSVADIALAFVAALLLILAAATSRGWHPSPGLAILVGAPIVAALALVIVKIADRPHVTAILPDKASQRTPSLPMDVKYGAVLALGSLVAGMSALVFSSVTGRAKRG